MVLYLFLLTKYSGKFLYILLGLMLWYFVFMSGIHATIAGVLLGMLVPYKNRKGDFSLLCYFEEKLHTMISYIILPIFAFVNSGVMLKGIGWDIFSNKVTMGIALGLFFGKQLGICGFVAIKAMFVDIKAIKTFTWPQFYSVSLLCGIGFTMSLFIGGLAFDGYPQYMNDMKLGVLMGTVSSMVFGGLVITLIRVMKK
jgi:NhaA family Na+:H+ antiporter